MIASEQRCPRCGAAAADTGWIHRLCPVCVLTSALSSSDPGARTPAEEPPEGERTAHEEPRPSIENYRILGLLGKGGGADVYLAEQEAPLGRKVALKVQRIGLDEQLAARFEYERTVLARMDHPYIAKVYDAGTTMDGRPYFAMELVDGLAITAFCDAHRMNIAERLELFQRVCEAVQHAHQLGIIHRDLKPSNVLVTLADAGPVPKVIDFGIARPVGSRVMHLGDQTRFGTVVGTPEYMSPEQASGESRTIDTRTDVYSLGVLLYELLTGVLPLDPRVLSDRTLDDFLSAVRELDPPPPSRQSASLGDRLAAVCASRVTTSDRLFRALRGDLDWILMRTLEKDPKRRYGSPSELAADLSRHIRNQPVVAGPPSIAYRLGKFVRRHRAGVLVTALLFFALLAGVFGTSIGLIRAVRAERAATAAERIASEEAKRAARQARTAEQVTDFLIRLFEVSDPSEARGNSVTAREVLDRGAEKIRRELGDEPRVEARLMDTMGRVYRNLGLFDAARPLLEEALRIREAMSPPDELEVARSLDSLGILHREMGEPTKALAMFERTLEIRQRILGPEHVGVASSLNNLASVHLDRGDVAEARRLNEKALAIREKSLPPDDPDLVTSRMNFGIALSDMGERERALVLLDQVRRVLEAKSPESPDLALVLDNLGAIHAEAGELDRAQPLVERGLHIRERALGPDHPEVANSLINLGDLLLARGNFDSARPRFERAIRILKNAKVPDHRSMALARGSLAALLVGTGRYAAAKREIQEAAEILTRLNGRDNSDTADILTGYADALRRAGRTKEADEVTARATAMRARIKATNAEASRK